MKMLLGGVRWMIYEVTWYGSVKEIYDDLSEESSYDYLVNYNQRVEQLRYALSFLTNTPSRVLDIACGTGAFIDALYQKNRLSVNGIDISSGMLKIAEKRFQTYPTVKLHHGDFMNADFEAATFDLVTVGHAIRFVPSKSEGIFARKVSNWIKKGGVFMVVYTQLRRNVFTMPLRLLMSYSKARNWTLEDDEALMTLLNPWFFPERRILIDRYFLLFEHSVMYFRRR